MTFPSIGNASAAILVIGDSASSVHVQLRFASGLFKSRKQKLGFFNNGRRVRTRHSAIRSNRKNSHARIVFSSVDNRMIQMLMRSQNAHGIENRIGIRLRTQSNVTRFGYMRRGNHLLRLENFFQGSRRGDARLECELRSHVYLSSASADA